MQPNQSSLLLEHSSLHDYYQFQLTTVQLNDVPTPILHAFGVAPTIAQIKLPKSTPSPATQSVPFGFAPASSGFTPHSPGFEFAQGFGPGPIGVESGPAPAFMAPIQTMVQTRGFTNDNYHFFRQQAPNPDLAVPQALIEDPFIQLIVTTVRNGYRFSQINSHLRLPLAVIRSVECALLIWYFNTYCMFDEHGSFRSIDFRGRFSDQTGVSYMDFARFQRLIDIIKIFNADFRQLIRGDNWNYRGATVMH